MRIFRKLKKELESISEDEWALTVKTIEKENETKLFIL